MQKQKLIKIKAKLVIALFLVNMICGFGFLALTLADGGVMGLSLSSNNIKEGESITITWSYFHPPSPDGGKNDYSDFDIQIYTRVKDQDTGQWGSWIHRAGVDCNYRKYQSYPLSFEEGGIYQIKLVQHARKLGHTEYDGTYHWVGITGNWVNAEEISNEITVEYSMKVQLDTTYMEEGDSITISWILINKECNDYLDGYQLSYSDYDTEIWMQKDSGEFTKIATVDMVGASWINDRSQTQYYTKMILESGNYKFLLKEYSREKGYVDLNPDFYKREWHGIREDNLLYEEESEYLTVKSIVDLTISESYIELGESIILNWNVPQIDQYYDYYTSIYESRNGKPWENIESIDGSGSISYEYIPQKQGIYIFKVDIYARIFNSNDNNISETGNYLLFKNQSTKPCEVNLENLYDFKDDILGMVPTGWQRTEYKTSSFENAGNSNDLYTKVVNSDQLDLDIPDSSDASGNMIEFYATNYGRSIIQRIGKEFNIQNLASEEDKKVIYLSFDIGHSYCGSDQDRGAELEIKLAGQYNCFSIKYKLSIDHATISIGHTNYYPHDLEYLDMEVIYNEIPSSTMTHLEFILSFANDDNGLTKATCQSYVNGAFNSINSASLSVLYELKNIFISHNTAMYPASTSKFYLDNFYYEVMDIEGGSDWEDVKFPIPIMYIEAPQIPRLYTDIFFYSADKTTHTFDLTLSIPLYLTASMPLTFPIPLDEDINYAYINERSFIYYEGQPKPSATILYHKIESKAKITQIMFPGSNIVVRTVFADFDFKNAVRTTCNDPIDYFNADFEDLGDFIHKCGDYFNWIKTNPQNENLGSFTYDYDYKGYDKFEDIKEPWINDELSYLFDISLTENDYSINLFSIPYAYFGITASYSCLRIMKYSIMYHFDAEHTSCSFSVWQPENYFPPFGIPQIQIRA
ncbi:MAG: hypothetical protein JXA99_04380 [Candidatus Lokiarchaeota archaeon]|nr:hypothetical protein [Candidatus Lokiarchaeota archaeon]